MRLHHIIWCEPLSKSTTIYCKPRKASLVKGRPLQARWSRAYSAKPSPKSTRLKTPNQLVAQLVDFGPSAVQMLRS